MGEVKRCTRCKRKKTVGLFSTRNARKGLLNSWCKQCVNLYDRENQSKASERKRRQYQVLKNRVYTAYGGYLCNCCQKVTHPAFLTLDHIHDNGAEHRRSEGIGGDIYRWAIKNNFPAILQVMCWNCQWGKRLCGKCPCEKPSLKNRSRPAA